MRINELIFEAIGHIEEEDYDSAIVKLNHALVLDGENIEVKKLLLEASMLRGDFETTKEKVDELLSIDNGDVFLLYLRANFLNDLEEHSKALETCNRIIELQDDFY